MFDRPVTAAEGTVGEGMALADRDRCQVDPVGDVAHGMDRGHAARRGGVDLDLAKRPHHDASLLQAEPLRVGSAAGGDEHDIGIDRRAMRAMGAAGAVRQFLDPLDGAAEPQGDAGMSKRVAQPGADVLVETAQDVVTPVQDGDCDAEPGEEAGEFERDIAAANDQQALRQRRQVEDLVGGDAELAARDRRIEGGPTAGRDQDMPGADHLPALRQTNLMRPLDDGALLANLDFGSFQPLAIEAGQAGHLVRHGIAQRRPVKDRGLRQGPAETGGILEIIGEAAGIDEELLGHAAADHAGAADAVLLRDHDPGAVAGGDARRARAARACPDDEQIDVELSHDTP